MNSDKFAELKSDMQGFIRDNIRTGFAPAVDIMESTVELYEEDLEPAELHALVEQLTWDTFEAHWKEQESWPQVTDCDHLDNAFIELECAGIVCRQDFSCCGTCGSAEIWDEMKEAFESGQDVRGYAFFHTQDTETALESGRLYLHYGSAEKGEEPALEIAGEIVASLNRHGLKTEWNGRIDTRIAVLLNWQRRRPFEVVISQESMPDDEICF